MPSVKLKTFLCALFFFSYIQFGVLFYGFKNQDKFTAKLNDPSVGQRCFCMLQGNVDDCSCQIETIDQFNFKIQSQISRLVGHNYFRYFKINLHKKCPFWVDDSRCALKDCAVEHCVEDEVPIGLKGLKYTESELKYSRTANSVPFSSSGVMPSCKEERNLSAIDESITVATQKSLKAWQKHDDKKGDFCELDDELSDGLQYVDLLKNREKFTGYSGPSAHRVWNSIYQENCFKDDVTAYQQLLTHGTSSSCLEKRAFYRVVSGLHTSINIHLCANYLLKGSPFDSLSGTWGPNVGEFKRRFDPESTAGRGPQWLRNLYFLYLLELRALAKAGPYFVTLEKFYTGNKTEDLLVQAGVKRLIDTIQSFDAHFDESTMFANEAEGRILKDEFRNKFRNISRIMDCVGCDKCKLWGKIQITGLGTALKILFPPDDKTFLPDSLALMKLTRSEIVALFNAFGQISNSIEYVQMFKDLLNS